MKTILIVTGLASLVLASSAQAQTAPVQDPAKDGVAAATLPNAFAPQRVNAASTPVAATPAAPPTPPPADPRAEPVLRAVIAAVQSSQPLDITLFSENAAAQMPEQEPPLRALLAGKGELVAILHRGQHNGAEIFQAVFEHGDTQWQIGIDEAGKLAVFLFRETPEAPEN